MTDTLKLGYTIPDLLVPASGQNMQAWAVIACDQYTSQPEYWKRVRDRVGDAPSTLNIILPEVTLDSGDVGQWIDSMHASMEEYVRSGVLRQLPAGIMLTERALKSGTRRGILLAMDLEAYDYDIEAHPLIRASERTVLERIPPRKRARIASRLDVPHVMLLIDDPNDTVIGPLHASRDKLDKIYGFDLMEGGGRVDGWLATDEKSLSTIADALAALPRKDGMLYCVGDGNHSLATAKTIWDEVKKGLSGDELVTCPLRYALCEVVNVHEAAVEFLPIHRVFFNATAGSIVDYTVRELNKAGADAVVERGREPQAPDGGFVLPFFSQEESGWLVVGKSSHPLAAGQMQPIFDAYMKENPGVRCDYIHGEDVVQELSAQRDAVGFVFPPVPKEDFFSLVVRCGVLPRKTFSIGHADDKRFYLEVRMLAPEEQGQ